jgi:acyl-CoA reductase-like NAD-dependent aldehyde dehydrogenase
VEVQTDGYDRDASSDAAPFLNGAVKRMLIDGRWVDAASGRTFESRNPATGEFLENVAEGDAVTAARLSGSKPLANWRAAPLQCRSLFTAE